MEIMCEPAEIVDVTHTMGSVTRQYPISRPRAWVLFTYDEYKYLEHLMYDISINWNGYDSIYEVKDNYIRIPLKMITDNLRLLTIADYANPNRQEEFIPSLRKLLGHGWL